MISDTFLTKGDFEISQEVSLCTTGGTTTANLSSSHNLGNTSSPPKILLEEMTDK